MKFVDHSVTIEAEQLGILDPQTKTHSQKKLDTMQVFLQDKTQRPQLKVIEEYPLEDEKMNNEIFLSQKNELMKQER